MVIDKKGKRLILFSVGMAAIFLGAASIIDIILYGSTSTLIFPAVIVVVGTYILYQSLKKLLKK